MVDLVKFYLKPPLSSDLTSKTFAFSWPEYSVELVVWFSGRERTSRGSGCSGQPGRIGYLGHPVGTLACRSYWPNRPAPRVPRPSTVGGKASCASSTKGQQCPPGWLDAGGDMTHCSDRWAAPVADGREGRACISREVVGGAEQYCPRTILPEHLVCPGESKFCPIDSPGRFESGWPTKVREVESSFYVAENSRIGHLVVGADHSINICNSNKIINKKDLLP
ncbi:hypothetical protein TIFTF001_032285 [Ficus carica]|uniref:Uncharacterized protein n=1 Tax=Ficus carica TaxID=3494 RepID=A0AA88DX72_FICCA|nr:hypothetical protein TIFTF001_032285 [Ficus carica]